MLKKGEVKMFKLLLDLATTPSIDLRFYSNPQTMLIMFIIGLVLLATVITIVCVVKYNNKKNKRKNDDDDKE